jgi:hypothetical protein
MASAIEFLSRIFLASGVGEEEEPRPKRPVPMFQGSELVRMNQNPSRSILLQPPVGEMLRTPTGAQWPVPGGVR